MTFVIIRFLDMLFNILEFAILAECILSWVAPYSQNTFVDIIRSFTRPVLEPCRRLQYRLVPNSPLDFSPIIALFAMDIVKRLVIGILI